MKKLFGFAFRSVLFLGILGAAAFCGALVEYYHPVINPGTGYASPVTDEGYRTDPEPVPGVIVPATEPEVQDPQSKYWILQDLNKDGLQAPDRIMVRGKHGLAVFKIPEAFRDLFRAAKEGATVPLPESWAEWDGYACYEDERSTLQSGWLPDKFPSPYGLGIRAKFVFAR